MVAGVTTPRQGLPVADRPVRVEAALQQLLLEGVLFDFVLVDLDTQPRFVARPDDPALLLDREALADDLLPPGDVQVHALADDVAGGREAQLQARRGADRALRVVRRERDAVRVAQRGDAARFAQPAAVRD